MMNEHEEQRQFERDGYVIVRGAYSPDQVKQLNREYEKIWLRQVANSEIEQQPDQPLSSLFPRMKDFHQSNETIRDLIFQPQTIEKLESLIGEEVHLISSNYYFKPPGMEGMPYHQDNYGIGVQPGTCHAVWICLDEADAANGGMRFLPGTHKLELFTPEKVFDEKADTFGGYVQVLQAPEGYDVVELKTSPGDIVIYHGHAIHDSADNVTADRFRRSLIVHFAGVSVERVLLNFNQLMDKQGNRVRKRMNTASMNKQS